MSTEYIKTNWQDGDIITADKMNNIENGIKDVEEAANTLKEDLSESVSDLKNAINYSNRIIGFAWNSGYVNANGVVEPSTGDRCYTNYIPCAENASITYVAETNHANICGISFYDEHYIFIEGYINNETIGIPVSVTSPVKTAYLRLSTKVAILDNTSLIFNNKQNETLPFLQKEIKENSTKIKQLLTPVKTKAWNLFALPSGFNMTPPVNILTDGVNYKTDFDAKKFLNSGGNTYYVSHNAMDRGDGSRSHPMKYDRAILAANDNDTIVLLSGFYSRYGNNFTAINKSINIIGEGEVTICEGNFITFTAVEGYSNVYSGTRTNGEKALDVSDAPNNILSLKEVSSIADCAAEIGSFYNNSDTFYVHPFKSGNPTNSIIVTVNSQTEIPMSVTNNTQSVNVYISNLNIVGSPLGVTVNMASSSNSCTVCYDHVNFIMCGNPTHNALTVYGGSVILNECVVDGSYRDGFNYNGTAVGGADLRDTHITEINCKAFNCGLEQTQETMNGSTSHKNTKIIRVNGEYHHNLGANCADVQDGTQSVNLGCIAYSSTATQGGNRNFDAQQPGATMWLYNCVGLGATDGDFNCVSGATMTLDGCTYNTKSQLVIATNDVPVDAYLLSKIAT